ncbi:unnamed protein product [Gordionus sp. m RMFG-2023]
MAPIPTPAEIVKHYIDSNKVIIFSKTTCPYCSGVKDFFRKEKIPFEAVELDVVENGDKLQQALLDMTGQRTVPNIFVNAVHVGGSDKLFKLAEKGKLRELMDKGEKAVEIKEPLSKDDGITGNEIQSQNNKGREVGDDGKKYDYDLIVLGGGSGGQAASKEAAKFGKKVAVFDYIVPTPIGTTWGLGGTCVNVGCIPKKLMHYAALLNETASDSIKYGWEYPNNHSDTIEKQENSTNDKPGKDKESANENQDKDDKYGKQNDDQVKEKTDKKQKMETVDKKGVPVTFKNPDRTHNWNTLVKGVQDYIHGLNFKYKTTLREKGVKYYNAYARFTDPHTIEAKDKQGKITKVTGKHFIVVTGVRPQYPDIPGAKEYCITSDDIFSLPYPPGKTLCIGASYVSLECAGFLQGIGFQTTVMVRSILLRGFDQQMAELIGKYMSIHGITFIRPAVPVKIEKIQDGKPGIYRVYYKVKDKDGNETEQNEDFNTIILAIGRIAKSKDVGLDTAAGIKLHPESHKVITDERDRSNIFHIYALGDNAQGRPELTPVAVEAGILLVRRLYGITPEDKETLCDYDNVPTTVFTPLEYGACGLSEEKAIDKFGEDGIEVYHTSFKPLEWTIPGREDNACYGKLIVNKAEKERVVGFHFLGPNAGEVTQGYAVAMKVGATKADFDRTIGIHPTNSEIYTSLTVKKSSGQAVEQAGC